MSEAAQRASSMTPETDVHNYLQIPVERLREVCDPYAQELWCFRRVTLAMVQACVTSGILRPTPTSSRVARDHAKRIAWFAVHGWTDHISIDVGVPSLGFQPWWIVTDGNHRLAAAIFRGDEFIKAEVDGDCNLMVDLFGITYPDVPKEEAA